MGASGSMGSAVSSKFSENGYEVWHSSRNESSSGSQNIQLIGDPAKDQDQLKQAPIFDAIVWAQGANTNDIFRSR